MTEFAKWLAQKMNEKGWNGTTLAKNAHISEGAISNILSEKRKPDSKTCGLLAIAFGVPADVVLQIGGHLQESGEYKLKPEVLELAYQMNELPPNTLAKIRQIANLISK